MFQGIRNKFGDNGWEQNYQLEFKTIVFRERKEGLEQFDREKRTEGRCGLCASDKKCQCSFGKTNIPLNCGKLRGKDGEEPRLSRLVLDTDIICQLKSS
jgi:hypothetical protein